MKTTLVRFVFALWCGCDLTRVEGKSSGGATGTEYDGLRALPYLIINTIVVGVAAYLGSYLRKKGENRAAQEDLSKLTRIVEEIRSEYVKQNQMLAHQQKLAIEHGTRRHQLRLAALERRLVAHQEAYARWWKLRFLIHTTGGKRDEFVVECQDWWAENCLFLEAESRKAFYDALNQANLHADLIRSVGSDEEKKSSWETINRVGQLLVKAVELPVINADEETPSSASTHEPAAHLRR